MRSSLPLTPFAALALCTSPALAASGDGSDGSSKPKDNQPEVIDGVVVEDIDLDEEPEQEPAAPAAPAPAEMRDEGGAEAEPDADSFGGPKNWLSLGFQQDFLSFGESDWACGGDNSPGDYTCFTGSELFPLSDETVSPVAGNRVSSGFGAGSSRLLLGFDRLLTPSISVGGRAGFAFGGPPEAPGGDAFSPIHLEARAAYWFSSSGFRPYVLLNAGMAEVAAGEIVAAYVDDPAIPGQPQTDGEGRALVYEPKAWKRAGRAFVGGGLGVHLGLTESLGLVVEGKVMQLFGKSGTAAGLQGGLAVGF